MDREFLCPVCGRYTFAEKDDFDICACCGWENDGLQADDHNYAGGANELSVNEARIEFFLINNEEKSEEAKCIRENYRKKKGRISDKHKDAGWSDEIAAEYAMARERYLDLLNELLNK